MKQFKGESQPDDDQIDFSTSAESREGYLPIITAQENAMIEESGGEYRGFLERTDGTRGFEAILISRHTYYDSMTRDLIEAFIATEAVNDEGGNELQGPGDVRGFSILVTRTPQSRQAIPSRQIMPLALRDLTASRQDMDTLYHLARELHGLVVSHVADSTPEELDARVEEFLNTQGLKRRQH